MKINKLYNNDVNILRVIINKIKSRFKGKTVFKQELLLRLALKEKGFILSKLQIKCNHDLGLNYVNGIELGIKYPDSFYNKATKLIPKSKSINLYFNGYMNESGKRSVMLEPFMSLLNTVIISSNEGRIESKKDVFNDEYFNQFAKSKYGLCPHQADWPGTKESMWTYRFIESCFVEAIPVLFKKSPLGEKFIRGFYFLWDVDFENSKEDIILEYKLDIAQKNRLLAKERFCLTEKECSKIKNTIS